MTVGKAALVDIVSRYQEQRVEVSLIDVQKLMYFLQAAGEPLNLRYAKDHYGPYADNLRHVLHAVEGHFLIGYGDASKTVHAAEPVSVLPGAVEEARAVIAEHPGTEERIQRVLRLAEGFESAYALELLATVHWVATHEDEAAAEDADVAVRLVGDWSRRKRRMFGPGPCDRSVAPASGRGLVEFAGPCVATWRSAPRRLRLLGSRDDRAEPDDRSRRGLLASRSRRHRQR